VVAQGLKLAIAGILFGVLASLGLARFIRTLLFGIEATDTWTFIGASVLLLAVAVAAAALPALRAARIPPVSALRSD
jgi:putative ABC transport system permease protein